MRAQDVGLAVALGCAAGAGILVVYVAALLTRGRPDVWRAVAYNGPIAVLFLVTAAYLLLCVMRLGLAAFLTIHVADLLTWGLALTLLYLRLGLRSIEVSGHLVWLPLLTAQSWAYRFPRPLLVLGALATIVACSLKFVVFRGPSGLPGILVGIGLAAAFLALRRRATSTCG